MLDRTALVSLFELSRLIGTSVDQPDETYGHLLPDSLDRGRTAKDTYVAAATRGPKLRGERLTETRSDTRYGAWRTMSESHA
jgi:hypothetical protein